MFEEEERVLYNKTNYVKCCITLKLISNLFLHFRLIELLVIYSFDEHARFDAEAVVQRCSVKRVFLKNSKDSQENTCARVSFLIKLQTSGYDFIKKETPAQVLSCEFCEIFKNTFFYRTLPVAASVDALHHFSFKEILRIQPEYVPLIFLGNLKFYVKVIGTACFTLPLVLSNLTKETKETVYRFCKHFRSGIIVHGTSLIIPFTLPNITRLLLRNYY